MGILKSTNLMIIGVVVLFVAGMLVSSSYAKVEPETIVGIWLLDEDGDGAVRDSSDNGHDGEFVGKAKWDKGKFGTALLFNGSTDSAKIPTQLINSEAGTIALWIRADNPTKDDQHIIYTGQGGGDGWCQQDEFHLGFRGGGPLNFSDCSGGGLIDNRLWDINAVVPVKGQWYHVAATWRAEEFAKLYVDGVLAGQKAPIPKFAFETWEDIVYIGKPAANKRFFEGAIDEIGIFNVDLDEDDIKTIMNQGLEKATGATAVSPTGSFTITWGQIKVQY